MFDKNFEMIILRSRIKVDKYLREGERRIDILGYCTCKRIKIKGVQQFPQVQLCTLFISNSISPEARNNQSVVHCLGSPSQMQPWQRTGIG